MADLTAAVDQERMNQTNVSPIFKECKPTHT